MVEARLYVRASEGRYTDRRWACIWLTQLVFFGLPWLEWDGLPALWLDLPARRLTLFGSWWWPHDLVWLVALLLLALCVLFCASMLAGRVFCGFACPHSVYGEIFMGIERRIEGKPLARQRRDRARLSGARLLRKAAKHGAWLAFAGWTGFTLAAYFTPAPQLLAEIRMGTLGPWQGSCIGAYAALAYLNAGAMRARFCRFICPWGRFQSLVIGAATLVIGYDAARGEPRALRNRKRLAQLDQPGACVDCTLCVQVCPTGIDIRRAPAFDCIGCGACADACDRVMDKLGAPRGLIGYAPAQPRQAFRTRRAAAWALLALALATMAAVVLAAQQRAPLKLHVMHERALPLRQLDQGRVENLYRLHVINTGRHPRRYRIAVSGLDTPAIAWPAQLKLDGGAARLLALRVQAAGGGRGGAQRIAVELVDMERTDRRVRSEAVFFSAVW